MSKSVCKAPCPDSQECKGEFCRKEALEIYKHTLNQRSTMFRFYLGVLGFYFAGIFFIVDKIICTASSLYEKVLLLVLMVGAGSILIFISDKFKLTSIWAHRFVKKMRDNYKFPHNNSEEGESYYNTFQSIYKLGQYIGWSVVIVASLYAVYLLSCFACIKK